LACDVVGNLISYDDGTTSASYTYDALGQKLTETVDYGPFTVSHSYEYYANGLKKSFTGPDNVKITYSYDENNRLSAIDIPNAGRITYNTYHWNHPAKITLPGGSQIDLTYDPLMRLLSKTVKDPSQQFLMDYEYEYSPTNNITKKTTEQGEHAYQYDELSRLTQATHPVLEDEHYTYDLLSNRLTASNAQGICRYDANNALLNYGNTEFEYDPNGNLVKKTTGTQITHYEYNIKNRLVRVTNSQDDLIAEYGYDPIGRRIWKKVEGIKTYFIYADEGLIGEYDENGTEIKAYGYRPDSIWTTNPLFQKTNGSYYWYQNDHLGTPQKLIDSQGDVVWEAVYEAFGKARVDVELVENHLRFAGQYFDKETGLHYNWHRYYEPTTGRYLSVDPILSANLYAYVSGNPLTFIDPLGLESEDTNFWINTAINLLDAIDITSDIIYVCSVAGSGGTALAASPVQLTKKAAIKKLIATLREIANKKARRKLSKNTDEFIKNQANHVFGPKSLEEHGLKDLLDKFNGDKISAFKVLDDLVWELADKGAIKDPFKTVVNIKGFKVTVRGRIINGVVKISTGYIPSP